MRDVAGASINMAVAEALSSEFKPSSDIEGRLHNLSRLILGSYNLGDLVDSKKDRFDIRYRPLWAPQVDVVTQWRRASDHNTFKSIALNDPYGTSLRILHDPFTHVNPRLVLTGVEDAIVSLEPGEHLVQTRQLVGEVAATFFEMSAEQMAKHVHLNQASAAR